ncbi:MAG TPA: carboxymuconolactone decarboxylase family protein [Chloroflexota bacterium]
MPRLTPITQRDQVAEDGRPSFDEIVASRGRINAPQSMLLYAPVLSARASSLNEMLSEADFELAVVAAAREFDIDYVWAAHVPTALRAGVTEATIETIRARGDLSALTPREQVIVTLAREMVGGHQVSAQTFDAARRELGERGLIEVIAAMGYYLMIGCVLIATDMELPAGASRLPR